MIPCTYIKTINYKVFQLSYWKVENEELINKVKSSKTRSPVAFLRAYVNGEYIKGRLMGIDGIISFLLENAGPDDTVEVEKIP